MNAFIRGFLALTTTLGVILVSQAAIAEEWNLEEKPWEKFGFDLGVFLAGLDSSIRIGSGIGVDIDVEEALGLDSTNTVFRTGALWRFTSNRRHRLDLSWFSFRRNGDRTILEDIPIEDDDGNTIIIETGTSVETFFNLDIYQLAYSYSFFQDERIDLAAGIGLYVMPIDFGIKVSGLLDEEESETFTAPCRFSDCVWTSL
jgi:hypothetical protein